MTSWPPKVMGAAGPEGAPKGTVIGVSVWGSLLGRGFPYRAWRGECQPGVLPPTGCGLGPSPTIVQWDLA